MEAAESSNALSYLRKESLDVYNRLHSIQEDIAFVGQIHEAYPQTPLLPNLRCGAWYTSPEIATNIPAYFKSTDGHNNNWGFNLRRANLHLLELLFERRSMVLVDSTRSGKRIPDALSKTVPIWCTVINRAMLIRHSELKEKVTWDIALYTPPAAVSMQEHHQIEQRLDKWAQDLAASSFSLPMLPLPLRPVWITPANSMFPKLAVFEGEIGSFLPVICVSASTQIEQGIERRSNGFSYVQGSGDDHELWSMGLTPAIFWKHHKELLSANRAHLPGVISRIVGQESSTLVLKNTPTPPTPVIKVDGRLLLSSIAEIPSLSSTEATARIVHLILTPSTDQESSPPIRYVRIVSGKRGQSHLLQAVLPISVDFIRRKLYEGKDVCVACDSGKDTSVGIVLAALSLFFDDDGLLRPTSEGMISTNSTATMNKKTIHTRLEWIIASRPESNPSRSTLKRVNEFLLTPASLRRIASPAP